MSVVYEICSVIWNPKKRKKIPSKIILKTLYSSKNFLGQNKFLALSLSSLTLKMFTLLVLE